MNSLFTARRACFDAAMSAMAPNSGMSLSAAFAYIDPAARYIAQADDAELMAVRLSEVVKLLSNGASPEDAIAHSERFISYLEAA